jgi:hypothetical protein
MDFVRLENELKKRWNHPYKWGRKQEDDWDKKTDFIYKTYSYKTLLVRIATFNGALQDYALNRWYNFWSAMAVEAIFTANDNVVPNNNVYDKLVDFTINNISFDHKTTVFPKGFNKSIDYSIKHKKELIQWLYDNQSQQGRKHLANRLFLVLIDTVSGEHWKMKAEIQTLKVAIDNYMRTFDSSNLTELDFGQGSVYADIIWLKKDKQ